MAAETCKYKLFFFFDRGAKKLFIEKVEQEDKKKEYNKIRKKLGKTKEKKRQGERKTKRKH